jgi:LAO/AO transport system kinase
LLAAIQSGDRRALARAATLLENRSPAARMLLPQLVRSAGKARWIGITGPPGAGKSTLVSALVQEARRANQRVAVLAVDPSSPITGGAILGDRVRMMEHVHDEGVWIRSLASRGYEGGLSAATLDLALLADAAGFDVIFIETVGAGQADVAIAQLAQMTVLVLVPGLGDDIQAVKAGLMEAADVIVLNKADLPGLETLRQQVEAAQGLSHAVSHAQSVDARRQPVLETVAADGRGLPELWAALSQYELPARQSNVMWARRLQQLFVEAAPALLPQAWLQQAAGQLARGENDPWSVIDEWIAKLRH